MEFQLFHYWRSSTSWRARAAFAYKNIPYQSVHVGLLNGENSSSEYLNQNPAGSVPTLMTKDGPIAESLAIIQYLENIHPSPSLIPTTPYERARAWQFAEVVNTAIHPLQNLNVLGKVSPDPQKQKEWAQYWIADGLSTLEALLRDDSTYCVGNSLTIADICLVPQWYNALRYEVNISPFPKLKRIQDHCLTLKCFQDSHPDRFKPID